MRKTYSEFCSRHTKALKLYKELYARDKRFQQFIRVSKPLQDPPSASCSAPALVDTAARFSSGRASALAPWVLTVNL